MNDAIDKPSPALVAARKKLAEARDQLEHAQAAEREAAAESEAKAAALAAAKEVFASKGDAKNRAAKRDAEDDLEAAEIRAGRATAAREAAESAVASAANVVGSERWKAYEARGASPAGWRARIAPRLARLAELQDELAALEGLLLSDEADSREAIAESLTDPELRVGAGARRESGRDDIETAVYRHFEQHYAAIAARDHVVGPMHASRHVLSHTIRQAIVRAVANVKSA